MYTFHLGLNVLVTSFKQMVLIIYLWLKQYHRNVNVINLSKYGKLELQMIIM